MDGKFIFAADESLLTKYPLNEGQYLTRNQVEKIVKETILGKLVDQALRFLSYRFRSEKEVADFLTKKISEKENIKFSEARESPVISQIITRLRKLKYLDDHQFAKWWIDSRIKSKPQGISLIKFELAQKGVDEQIILDELENYPDQLELAKTALTKKIGTWYKLSSLDLKKKIYSYLLRRGFNYEIAKSAFAFFDKKR